MTTESLLSGDAREFTTRNVPWRSYVAGGCLGLCGLLFAAAVLAGVIGFRGGDRILFVGLGLFFFLVGIGLPIAIFFFRKTQAITCRPDGFTVRTEWGGKRAQKRDYRWEAVTSTDYSEVRGKARTRTRNWRFVLFKVETNEGQAFAVDDQISDLAALIRIFNVMTPHLPYVWEPPTGSEATAPGSGGGLTPYFVQTPRPKTAALPSVPPPSEVSTVRAETIAPLAEQEPVQQSMSPAPQSQPPPPPMQSSQPPAQSFAEPDPAIPPPRSKLPWILGGCGCFTLLVIIAGVLGFGVYKYQTTTPKRPTAVSASPAPSPAPLPPSANNGTDRYGTRSEFNRGELFRTATVTEAEATKLGNFLVQNGFFDGAQKSVQLNKTGATYEFRMVANPAAAQDPAFAEMSKTFAGQLSTQVFSGSPVVVHLCDSEFQTLRIIAMDSSGVAPAPTELLGDGLKTFVSTMDNIPADHRPYFVPFRIRYPSSFAIEKREHSTFVGLYRYTATGSNMGNFEVTWFEAKEGTKAETKRDLDKISKQWGAYSQFKYKELKRYRETVGGVEGDAILFEYTMPDRQGGFVAGGKSILVRRPGETRGVLISVYNTWEDPKIKRAADVGVTDELATILRSFEFL